MTRTETISNPSVPRTQTTESRTPRRRAVVVASSDPDQRRKITEPVTTTTPSSPPEINYDLLIKRLLKSQPSPVLSDFTAVHVDTPEGQTDEQRPESRAVLEEERLEVQEVIDLLETRFTTGLTVDGCRVRIVQGKRHLYIDHARLRTMTTDFTPTEAVIPEIPDIPPDTESSSAPKPTRKKRTSRQRAEKPEAADGQSIRQATQREQSKRLADVLAAEARKEQLRLAREAKRQTAQELRRATAGELRRATAQKKRDKAQKEIGTLLDAGETVTVADARKILGTTDTRIAGHVLAQAQEKFTQFHNKAVYDACVEARSEHPDDDYFAYKTALEKFRAKMRTQFPDTPLPDETLDEDFKKYAGTLQKRYPEIIRRPALTDFNWAILHAFQLTDTAEAAREMVRREFPNISDADFQLQFTRGAAEVRKTLRRNQKYQGTTVHYAGPREVGSKPFSDLNLAIIAICREIIAEGVPKEQLYAVAKQRARHLVERALGRELTEKEYMREFSTHISTLKTKRQFATLLVDFSSERQQNRKGSPNDPELVQRVRELRTQAEQEGRKIGKRELAETLGVSESTIARITRKLRAQDEERTD